jgi:hypothetical protein
VAYKEAGIDSSHWDPLLGVEANRQTIEKVYDYYGDLYQRDTRLQWAGMANLIGPSFYAGFLDVGVLPDWERRVLRSLVYLGRRLVAPLRRGVATEGLGFYETTFLRMQRKIFEDQAMMHEAFFGGGLAAVDALGAAGVLDRTTVACWHQIATSQSSEVQNGNRVLLFREQYDIIDRFYVEMRAYSPPLGHLFTWALTAAGKPAIPDARPYAKVFPVTVCVRLGKRSLELRTPFPAGNIAIFADRWALIERDTLPAYDQLLARDPGGALRMIAKPVAERAGHFRLLRRIGYLIYGLATDWRLRLGPPTATSIQVIRTRGGSPPITIDLTAPPGEVYAWSAPEATFPLTVALPTGLQFHEDVQSAALVASSEGAPPMQLVVKLAASTRDEAQANLMRLANELGADRRAINRWAAAARAATPEEHGYAARVFPAHSHSASCGPSFRSGTTSQSSSTSSMFCYRGGRAKGEDGSGRWSSMSPCAMDHGDGCRTTRGHCSGSMRLNFDNLTIELL